jgi:hypothetical protein
MRCLVLCSLPAAVRVRGQAHGQGQGHDLAAACLELLDAEGEAYVRDQGAEF